MATATSEQKLSDIREAIQAGMSSTEIIQLLRTSAGTIVKVKRELGIPIRPMRQTRTRGLIKAMAEVAVQDVPPPALTVPRPEAYVTAFENRVLEYHTLLKQKDATHEQELLEKDGTIERLKRELAKLMDEYAQRVFQQANWQGPTSIMTQSLGNGG